MAGPGLEGLERGTGSLIDMEAFRGGGGAFDVDLLWPARLRREERELVEVVGLFAAALPSAASPLTEGGFRTPFCSEFFLAGLDRVGVLLAEDGVVGVIGEIEGF